MGYTESLRARGRGGLVELLTLRPDLATPPPTSLRALAGRATHRASLDRALAGLDATTLQVLEAAVALAGPDAAPGPADLTRAVGHDAAAAVARALAHGLLHEDAGLRPAPGLDELFGPYPAGLGPRLTATLGRRDPAALAELAATVGLPDGPAGPGDLLPRLVTHLADPGVVDRLLAESPPGARAVLEALTWGPPVGRTGTSAPARAATAWLARHGLLAGTDDGHVILPREIALQLRGGRTHREPALRPHPTPAPVPPTVDAEAALAAEETVRRIAALVTLLGAEPAAVLRSGGIGQRETRRIGAALGVGDAGALLELAAAAGLIADDGEAEPVVAPTVRADEWLRTDLPERWAHLAAAWLTSDRAAWLVGTRDDTGALFGALDPELRRPRIAALRHRVLTVLAETPLDPPGLAEVLAWATPRVPVPEAAVAAIRAEAAALGVLVADAVSAPGRALLARADAAQDATDPAEALAAVLPEPVDEIVLQGDLTGIVPGRPTPALAALLDRIAVVESRGAATTVRFTEATVRAALDTGATGEQLLSHLARHARTTVPQPLEYLVLDAARRHGVARVGAAFAYVRSEDPALLAGLEDDRALRGLGLVRLAPTVLAATATPAALLAALRTRGLAPVLEGPAGAVVVPHRARRRRATEPTAPEPAETRRRAETLADRLLRAAPEPAAEGIPDPVGSLALLREAAEAGRDVWLELAGPGGPTVRRVRPLTVDGGRVRARDTERETELTVAVHRIVSVTTA